MDRTRPLLYTEIRSRHPSWCRGIQAALGVAACVPGSTGSFLSESLNKNLLMGHGEENVLIYRRDLALLGSVLLPTRKPKAVQPASEIWGSNLTTTVV